jgi:hypothetical protein
MEKNTRARARAHKTKRSEFTREKKSAREIERIKEKEKQQEGEVRTYRAMAEEKRRSERW